MLRMLDMLRKTSTARIQRARACVITQFAAQLDYDELDRPHCYCFGAVTCDPPHGSGILHKIEARIYVPMGTLAPSWISCDCGDACFRWEVALTKKHSSSKRYSNGNNPVVTNPAMITSLCKHAVRFLTKVTSAARVRKILFGIPNADVRRLKQIMDQRGIPEQFPRLQPNLTGRPTVRVPTEANGHPRRR